MSRRAAGALLCVAGIALLGYAGAAYGRGALARDRARAAWSAAEAHRAVAVTNASLERGGGIAAPRAGAPVARLLIPKIGLDEIVIEGVGADQLNVGPGHLPGSVLPGEAGNAILSAHRDRQFHSLDELAQGDTVVTETARERVVWVVRDRRILDRAAPALFASAEPVLTLTTCWPVRYFGPAPDRLLLTARPVARTTRA